MPPEPSTARDTEHQEQDPGYQQPSEDTRSADADLDQVSNERDESQDQGPEPDQNDRPAPDNGPAHDPADNDHLKIVLSITQGAATIAVQRPPADPVYQAFDIRDPHLLIDEIPGVLTMAEARWKDEPKYPVHNPPRRRSQGTRTARPPAPTQPPTPEPPRLF